MTLRHVPNTDVSYYLICFDKTGCERREDTGALASETVRDLVADAALGITDVFILSHGWKGDVPSAIEQFDRWIGEMAKCTRDREAAGSTQSHFRPLIVGLHWPSLPWGDERQATPSVNRMLTVSAADLSVDRSVDRYAEQLADTPRARDALRTILMTAEEWQQQNTLPRDVVAAYAVLRSEAGLTSDSDMGPPSSAQLQTWDAQLVFQMASDYQAPSVVGNGGASALLSIDDMREAFLTPLRQLSFWKMKDRARIFGETGACEFLQILQKAAPISMRFHLMGHSFGCIVVSAALAGRDPGKAPMRPINSLFLVQGALSLWAFCPDIPFALGTAGYFQGVIADGIVRGPIVATRSSHDTAVGRFYPMGAELASEFVLDAHLPMVGEELPKYGGIGTFGVQGLGPQTTNLFIAPEDFTYGFRPGHVYNIDASRVIASGSGASGAHSDISHPEVAHIAWQAAVAGF